MDRRRRRYSTTTGTDFASPSAVRPSGRKRLLRVGRIATRMPGNALARNFGAEHRPREARLHTGCAVRVYYSKVAAVWAPTVGRPLTADD
jgi:hypothetical protein